MLLTPQQRETLHRLTMDPCSDGELERRWAAASRMMTEKGLDYLLVFQRTDSLGGYIKWFTDWSIVDEYMATIIFSKDCELVSITPTAGRFSVPPAPAQKRPPDHMARGVARRYSFGYFPSYDYSMEWDAACIVEELAKKGKIKVGLVGKAYMTVQCYEYLHKHLTQATIVDATQYIDELKVIKSEEEIAMIRRMASLQDEVMYTIEKYIEPGLRNRDILAKLRYESFRRGSEGGTFMIGTAPMGSPIARGREHTNGNQFLNKGDYIDLLLEPNAPSGMYGHISAMFCLGEPTDELYSAWEIMNEAYDMVMARLVPGADCNEIFNDYNEWLAERKLPPETRLLGHGQGFELIEKPAMMPGNGETIKLAANMNFSFHPTIVTPKAYVTYCANYIIQADGPPLLMHNYPFRTLRIL